ncbi:MAG: YihY family inner membrane protein [Deltaproteobacteria bacterium]|nr:YihY family inner membrane protein [Deltaproteobacteria bacterium]
MKLTAPLPPFVQRLLERLRGRVRDSSAARFVEDLSHAVLGVAFGFRGEPLSLRAGALTFISLFSLLPLLAVALGLLGLLKASAVQAQLEEWVHGVLAPGVRAETTALLDRFLDTAVATQLSSAGGLLLLLSASTLLRSLDESINAIWHVRERRPFWIRMLIYLAVLVVGPVAVGLSITLTGRVREFLFQGNSGLVGAVAWATTLGITVAALSMLYLLAPATRVHRRAALAGGVFAGLTWEMAKHGYAAFAASSFKYSPVYATLGALPAFLLWIYVSWMLVLLGARVAYTVQHASYRGVILALERHPRAREMVAARMAQLIAAAALTEHAPPTPGRLARQLGVPDSTAHETLSLLASAGLVKRHRGGVVPARPPAELTVGDISLAVGGLASLGAPGTPPGPTSPLERLFESVDAAALQQLSTLTWAELARSHGAENP